MAAVKNVVVMALVVMVVMVMRGGEAIPSKVGNRMVPSWWINARSKRSCQKWSDCTEGECCARPMLATKAYCFPYKTLGASCSASALLVNMENEVFLDHCPCDVHLTCANLYLGTGARAPTSVCVDPDVAFDRTNTAETEAVHRPQPFPKQVNF
ncbi:uncharacterized protein LOC127000586 [Eriocheir sinensis]|uniref:uncharacterized protein LOC127000586 n=1 Tax=Eriocheir sinensis TaxID=95602 RepID=UPI0021C6E63D|nr:uncharacterized protein LOC127000586 [Eriocheir sinensis]